MQNIKNNIWPVMLGFGVASLVMFCFEFINSFLFPFPPGLDYRYQVQLLAFTKAQPDTLYILVMIGWIFGTAFGAYTLLRLTKDKQKRLVFLSVFAVLLTVFAAVNNFLVLGGVGPWWVEVFGFVVFGVVAFLTYTMYIKNNK